MLNSTLLAKALWERYPDLTGHREFLRSVLVVEGLAPDFTEDVLRNLFADFRGVAGSCIIYDNIGGPAGVVLFDSAASCSAAARSEPAPPYYRRAIRATALDMRNSQRCYGHLSNLIGVLYAATMGRSVYIVPGGAMDDPNFLERSVLLEGVATRMSPHDLLVTSSFEAQEAVLVRDAEFGDRVGLVVLKDASEYAAALAGVAPWGSYCSCFPARRLERLQILDMLDDCARRQPTANLLRSLIPPKYIYEDNERELHLYCMFLRGFPISDAGGAHGLCRIATDKLLHVGPFSAVIIRRDENVGVLVCNASWAPDAACARAHPHLLRESKLVMYDSSLFPLAPLRWPRIELAQHRLPPFITPAEYMGRVVLLTGLDTNACDAAEVAGFVETKLTRDLDAVIVHGGVDVLVVAQTTEDAQAILQLAPEEWFKVFGKAVRCTLFKVLAVPPLGRPEDAGLRMRMLEPMMSTLTSSYMGRYSIWMLDHCSDRDLRGLLCGLYAFASVVRPNGLGRAYFLDRAVLLTGIDIREPRLRVALLRSGSLDGVVCHRGVGLAVFEYWIGASRLLRESPSTWRLLGFSCCYPPPRDCPYIDFCSELTVRDYLRRRSGTTT
ncbi:hypothetical protein QOZ80_7AG0578360 [Eleusine coracana subsp. coracana]|nr:hypothetical protein QOZ80_7AG0578360 [Eleusine coracana subsp. coracana]